MCFQVHVQIWGIVWAWLHLPCLPRFCASLFSSYFTCVELDMSVWISVEGTFQTARLFSSSYTSYTFLLPYIPPSSFCISFSLLYISLPCGACFLLFCCQFSQSVAYATVCICIFITDAPHWQQVQLCMALCFFLISLEILSGVVVVVQRMWMCVCMCVCMHAAESRWLLFVYFYVSTGRVYCCIHTRVIIYCIQVKNTCMSGNV